MNSHGISGWALALGLLVSATGTSPAAVMAGWTFDNTWAPEAGDKVVSAIAPTTLDAGAFSSATLSAFAGGDPGSPFVLKGNPGGQSTLTYADADLPSNLNNMFTTLSMTAAENLINGFTITYTARATGAYPSGIGTEWQYRIGEFSSFTVFDTGTVARNESGFDTYTATLVGPQVPQGALIEFRSRLTTEAGIEGTGTFDFNSISITPVPEPVHYALGIFGALVGLSAWFRKVRARN